MRRLKLRNDDGSLSRAARGEGRICPRCKTFAPLGPDGENRCTICGLSVRRVSGTPVLAVAEAPAHKPGKLVLPPRAPRMIPSATLGRSREKPQVQEPSSLLVEALKMPSTIVEVLLAGPLVEEEAPLEDEEESSSKKRKRWK